MTAEPKRVFFITLWHLTAALLLGLSSFASVSDVNKKDDVSTGSNIEPLETLTSLDLLYQKEHKQFPPLPENGEPSEKIESEEGNNQKDDSGDDNCSEKYHLKLPFAALKKYSSNCSVMAEIGGKRIPLFLLYHCWKEFLS